MAWNESGNGKNPWDRGRGGGGPPDLDTIVRDWQRKLGGLFGGKGGRDTGAGGNNGSMLTLVLVVVLLGWAATGLYRVNDADCAGASPGPSIASRRSTSPKSRPSAPRRAC
jgi:membrane protease subunit HflK